MSYSYYMLFSAVLICSVISSPLHLEENILSRVKRRSSRIDELRTEEERKAFQELVERWDSHYALGYSYTRVVYNGRQVGRDTAHLDMQNYERVNGGSVILERYAIQIGTRYYSVVHIEHGVRFGVALIRRAFEESRDHRAHVFLTSTGTTINIPDDGHTYEHRVLDRFWNGQWVRTFVWGVTQALDHLVRWNNMKTRKDRG